MGIFHCVPSGCAEVRYQKYKKAGGIRYRYRGEEWITIDGDNYEVNNLGLVCQSPRIYPEVYARFIIIDDNRVAVDSVRSAAFGSLGSVYQGLSFDSEKATFTFKNADGITEEKYVSINQFLTPDANTRLESVTFDRVEYWLAFLRSDGSISDSSKLDFSNGIPNWLQNNCSSKCEFIIYKQDEIVHQETRTDCPEVEILESDNCELSDRTEVIRIEKTPFLERVEVTDFDYQNFGANLFRRDIPDNCLVVRKNYTTTIPPLPGGVPTPSNSPLDQDYSYGFIAQICSDEGCPPPEYEAICNCQGEECPPNTCPVECGSTVCCYDPNTGISVEEIPLENYRGGGL